MTTHRRNDRKGMALFLATLLILPILCVLCASFRSFSVQAETKTASFRYFYNQLTAEEKPFYHAMERMYKDGLFQTGNGELDLTGNGYLTQTDIQSYAGGYTGLLDRMGAARDAFYFDYPDVFYVDFSALTLRVTRDSSMTYHAYLGAGRRSDYYTPGFQKEADVKKALAAYEEKISGLADAAKNRAVGQGMDPVSEQITFVHNEITRMVSYRLENTCTPGNEGFLRTAYGALVKGEGACEAYARSMKAVLDRLGIPCILVQGVYRTSSGSMELHMWNYVQLNDKWYGVDATMDDPIAEQAHSGHESSEFLMVGGDVLGVHHMPSGILSPANREFSYPSLTQDSRSFEEIVNSNGLSVEYLSGQEDGIDTGTFRVSYNGMGYQKAAKEGHYILARFYQYYPDSDKYLYTDWIYADPAPYMIPQQEDALILPAPHIMFAEFAVTTTPPLGVFASNGTVVDKDYYYFKGDPLLFVAQTEKIYNQNGFYTPPPYPKTYSPSTQGRVYMGQTYDIRIEYDQTLRAAGDGEVGYLLTSTGSTGVQYSEVKNFQWDGKSTFTFQFTPSSMYADESVLYTFQFTGVVSADNGKEPVPVKYVSSAPCAVCAYRSQGYDWNVFGQPALLENTDLSTAGWKTSDGSEVDSRLTDRLALVVTRPSHDQSQAMEDLVQSENAGQLLSSETYNIDLTLCNSQIIQTGQGVRVCVGFPKGYGPEDEGVTFKAYHFKRDASGAVIDVEEIDCVVTKFGLVITCTSFSPFAIVAVEGETPVSHRNVLISSSYGGRAAASDQGRLLTLAQDETASVTVTAQEGYQIQQIDLGGKRLAVTDKKSMTVPVSYSDLTEDSEILQVQFAADSVVEKEKEKNESPVLLSPEDVVVPLSESAGGSKKTPAPASTPSQQTKPQTNPASSDNKDASSNPAAAATAPAAATPAASAAPAQTTAPPSRPASSAADPAVSSAPAPSADSEPSETAQAQETKEPVKVVSLTDPTEQEGDQSQDLIPGGGFAQASDKGGFSLSWLILPAVLLAAILGVAIYYIVKRNDPRDRQ